MEIRIISAPPGEAPDHVRAAWVGLVLPVAILGAHYLPTVGVLSRPKSRLGTLLARLSGKIVRHRGFIVASKQAIEILARQEPGAADWWRQNTPHLTQPGQYLLFHAEACEEVVP